VFYSYEGVFVVPWVELATAIVPGGGKLRLIQRGAEFSIMAGPIVLMNSRLSGSEKALAALAAQKIGGRPHPRMLIGGLGMGFTLRAALDALGGGAEVVVAELVPEVIAWAKGPMAPVFGTCLADPRVNIREGDVGQVMRTEKLGFDAIVLDVDNGPEGLTRNSNDALYGAKGLAAAAAALRPGGVYAVWSSGPDANFARRLHDAGFAVEEHKTRANGARGGARHIIWVGTKRSEKVASAAHPRRPRAPRPLGGRTRR